VGAFRIADFRLMIGDWAGTCRIADFRLTIGDQAGTYRATFFIRQSTIINQQSPIFRATESMSFESKYQALGQTEGE
jgi:hypothetical protein